MAVEQVARWPWNAWPDERGLGGRMVWNPHYEAKTDLLDYIRLYNHPRRHSTLGYLSPIKV